MTTTCTGDHTLTVYSSLSYVVSISGENFLGYYLPIACSFDCCSLVWDTCCYSDSTRLQRLQNYAICIILKLPKCSSASEALSNLYWTSLSDRQLLSLSQQSLQPKLGKNAPSYLRNLLTNVLDIQHHHTRGTA